jgi:hypothetical protein
MRRIVLTLLVALPSLAFAPAPFPKPERPARESEEARLVREYDARLRDLGVTWKLRTDYVRHHVSFEIRNGKTLDFTGSCTVNDGNVLAALMTILDYVVRRRDALK